jgi:ferredoxin
MQQRMKTKRNRIIGTSFFLVLAAMIVFNSCEAYTETYSVNTSDCTLCLACITACGQHAISLVSGNGTTTADHIVIDKDRCVGCGKCYKACSYKAISSN